MAVTRLELTSKPYAGGRDFADVGPVEELLGLAHVAFDPSNPRNATIADLNLAPRGEDGRVHVTADVSILRPMDAAKRNRRLFLDVVNRGNPIMMRLTDSNAFGEVSAGWLLQQ